MSSRAPPVVFGGRIIVPGYSMYICHGGSFYDSAGNDFRRKPRERHLEEQIAARLSVYARDVNIPHIHDTRSVRCNGHCNFFCGGAGLVRELRTSNAIHRMQSTYLKSPLAMRIAYTPQPFSHGGAADAWDERFTMVMRVDDSVTARLAEAAANEAGKKLLVEYTYSPRDFQGHGHYESSVTHGRNLVGSRNQSFNRRTNDLWV
jgi:hypothetical protein